VGGVVGYNSHDRSLVEYCYSASNVTATDNDKSIVGGVVGENYRGFIEHCYATGNVEGLCYTGGIIGYNEAGWIANCYAAGKINGRYNLGGIAGMTMGGSISRCVALNTSITASGATPATSAYGRIIGYQYGGPSINYNYARSDMVMAVTASYVPDKTKDGNDGEDITPTNYGDIAWWRDANVFPPILYRNEYEDAWWDDKLPPTLPLPVRLFTQLAPTVTVTVEATEGGATSHDGENSDTFMSGDTVTVTALPDEGYVFVEWRMDKGEGFVFASDEAEYAFAVTGDVALLAVFEPETAVDGVEGGENPPVPGPEDEIDE